MYKSYSYLDSDYIYTEPTSGILRNTLNISDPKDLLFA